ncbi:glycosyltransferase family 22 protein [Vararia minispora EC-137]|uniref:Glycosyltransferase family 22 protein n=1 Tax=Vararia minispora EC-137 TaxID=1314806 RepID=A0ACB8QRL7_9AGAM|nr:glycosyltransferase family 22 protein [Vararia minispora EC-137]
MRRGVVIPLCLRILIAVCTRTFFQPDEYFQSLEPAHRIVFGYGHLTWEWLAENPIRSIAYPALTVPVYWLLKILGLDDTVLLVFAPKILHGTLAAGTDIWVQTLASKVVGERYVCATLFVSLVSWFHALSLSRSLSNSLETTLTTIALCYLPAQLRKFLFLAALACMVRITNVFLWVYLAPIVLWQLRSHPTLLLNIVPDAVFIAVLALSTLAGIDSLYYRKFTITPLSFLLTNASPVSLFYGSAPWHYYLTQALPLLCGPALPYSLLGIRIISKERDVRGRTALGLVAWTILVYSCAGHKEWRFLHPILPLLHIFAAKHLVDAFHSTPLTPTRRPALHISNPNILILSLSIPFIVYTALFHSSAQIAVTRYLHALPANELKSTGFLMPCHSVPGQAYVHRADIEVWALGCEPPLGLSGAALQSYVDQTDVFYASPSSYLDRYFPEAVDTSFPPSPLPTTPPGAYHASEEGWNHTWPSHIVMFGALLESGGAGVREKLETMRYEEVWKAGTGLEEDPRRRGGVHVWKFVDAT